jgi:hypothetical protein
MEFPGEQVNLEARWVLLGMSEPRTHASRRSQRALEALQRLFRRPPAGTRASRPGRLARAADRLLHRIVGHERNWAPVCGWKTWHDHGGQS